MGALHAVDGVEKTKFDGVSDGNAVVEVPGAEGTLDFGFLNFDLRIGLRIVDC
jgi:hypothetical protein